MSADLIARLEAASGPDRELDCRIWVAVNGKGQPLRVVGPPTYDPQRFFCNPNPEFGPWIGYDLLNNAPAYTASIDAALTLVPKGWARAVDATAPECLIDVDLFAPEVGGPEVRGTHDSEPTATCIAALKARAASGGME